VRHPLADWPVIRQRLEAFWAREILDRPIIQVTAPLPDAGIPIPAEPATLEDRYTDPVYQLTMHAARQAATYYAGDAFPTYRPVLGPGFLAGLLGAPVAYAPGTVWYHPCVTDLEAETPLTFSRRTPLWRRFARLMRAAAGQAPSHFILGQTDMVPPTDILATLLGPAALCMAMIGQPGAVKRWLASLTDTFVRQYRAQAALLPADNGYTAWLTTWSPTPSYALQNDFSCMISAEMFREFCLPELDTLTEVLDYSVYHLDGPGAIQHLDALLSLPRLHAIQWTPGDGQPPMAEWIPLLRRIQAGGKGLYLYCLPEEVAPLLEALRPEGVIIQTWANTPAEADSLVELAGRIPHH